MRETDRLRLHRLSENDLLALGGMMRRPEIGRLVPGYAKDLDEFQLLALTRQTFLKPSAKAEVEYDIGCQRVELKNGAFAGLAGFFPPPGELPDCGPMLVNLLAPGHRGYGYAAEASADILGWFWRMRPQASVCVLADEDSEAEQAVARRLGFKVQDGAPPGQVLLSRKGPSKA